MKEQGEASAAEVQTLMQFMGSFEPIRYLCSDGCGRSVAKPKSFCILCGNTRNDPPSQVVGAGR